VAGPNFAFADVCDGIELQLCHWHQRYFAQLPRGLAASVGPDPQRNPDGYWTTPSG